ncbi:MAG: HAD family hydrolase, partial [bacterium]
MIPIRAVIFDFHATLVDQGDADEWLDRAVARAGAGLVLDERDRETVTRRLDDIWVHAREIDPGSGRDLSAANHREVVHGVMDGHVTDDLRHALYDVMLDLWRAYDEAPGVLSELRRRGMATAILSNVGVDIRPVMAREGLVVDAV